VIDHSALNPSQLDVVRHGEGPVLVVAAAGSGKTKTLVHRVADLVDRGVAPDSLLLVTFTRKAAIEMFDRLTKLTGDAALVSHITGGTFHSVCLRWLREDDPTIEVIPEWKVRSTIKGLIGGPSKMWPQAITWNDADLSTVLHLLSLARNERMTPEDLEADAFDGPVGEKAARKLAELWRLYDAWKRAEGVVDFDDMLILALERLEEDDAFRARIQERYEWLLVDETQDTNRVQWDLLKLMAAPQNNITAVGDVRQSIYGWRGAKPEQFLAFAETFPGARIIGLEHNYRSDEHVIRLANAIAAAMPEDHADLIATRPAEVEPVFREYSTPDDEAKAIVEEISQEVALGESPEWFSVLYRTNAQSRAVEDACLRARVPYIIVGSQGFYARSEVQDMLAYLRISLDPDDRESIARVISRPTRYLGKAFLADVEDFVGRHGGTFFDSLPLPLKLKDWQIEKAREFTHLVRMVRTMPPAVAIRTIRERTEYDHWLSSEEGTESEDSSRIENLNELVVAAGKFGKTADFLEFARAQQEAAKDQDPRGRVVLSTIHRSKGLEWPCVDVIGVSEGLLPHKRAVELGDVAEERRLRYVAATRARDRLVISGVKEWQSNDLGHSRFLREVGIAATQPVEEVPA